MTGAPGFLEFFILEASEYVQQLDGLLLGGSSIGPDARALQRVARALRGTATMAKLSSFADVAAGVERVARAMQDGVLQWDPALGGALVAAVDDLKVLLHSARTWSPADDQRAVARADELARFAPTATAAQPRGTTAPAAADSAFLATEAANIAAGLELLTTRGDTATAANVLGRVRALRGVASVKEVTPLSDTLEATEDAARGLESGDQQLSAESRRLLDTAAAYLRTLSVALRSGASVDAPDDTRDAFAAAQEAWRNRAGERERIVPIAELFYGDGSPGLVEASANPPTSAQERFRLELVSFGEHLREVVAGARIAKDPAVIERTRRHVHDTLVGLQADAESFGETEVAAFIGDHVESAGRMDFLGLAALEDLASVLAHPGAQGERMATRLREIAGERTFASAIGSGFESGAPTPSDAPPTAVRAEAITPMPPPVSTPPLPTPGVDAPEELVAEPIAETVAEPIAEPDAEPDVPAHAPLPAYVELNALDIAAAALIDSGIAALDRFTAQPFSQPTPIAEDIVVPIESLLYSGRAALDRAVEIRDQLRRTGPTSDTAALEEIFDLLELAQVGTAP